MNKQMFLYSWIRQRCLYKSFELAVLTVWPPSRISVIQLELNIKLLKLLKIPFVIFRFQPGQAGLLYWL